MRERTLLGTLKSKLQICSRISQSIARAPRLWHGFRTFQPKCPTLVLPRQGHYALFMHRYWGYTCSSIFKGSLGEADKILASLFASPDKVHPPADRLRCVASVSPSTCSLTTFHYIRVEPCNMAPNNIFMYDVITFGTPTCSDNGSCTWSLKLDHQDVASSDKVFLCLFTSSLISDSYKTLNARQTHTVTWRIITQCLTRKVT